MSAEQTRKESQIYVCACDLFIPFVAYLAAVTGHNEETRHGNATNDDHCMISTKLATVSWSGRSISPSFCCGNNNCYRDDDDDDDDDQNDATKKKETQTDWLEYDWCDFNFRRGWNPRWRGMHSISPIGGTTRKHK
jgi:hypothetical protein